MKHLSYRQFKNIFGDWGVTAWVKFNWLSNGLPDGTYNGITKVTIKTITNINNNKRALINSVMPIAPADNNTVWQYGYASLKIISGNASYQGVTYNNVSVDANGYMFIQIPSIAQTKEAYEEYLNKYPVVFYFYDRREWVGSIVNYVSGGVTVIYTLQPQTFRKDVRDVLGTFETKPTMNNTDVLESSDDLFICSTNMNGYNEIYFKDNSIGTGESGARAFIRKYCPRPIVYKI